ncbi:synaptic plasticity regulator PANTS isoform X1 [Desmodus rotundus]|uniref:synaptic plasticity regulator PANTS isoform X1 n=1 Tax=Desmodus rotundus TaxID=9430 RepID=UPI002380F215|nr:UPF0545 protein C22orf39 homolog isoform X1 [Desmodus rotundus]
MAEGAGWRPPRPCEAYRAEWKLCRSAGHFLHHYYVHGERPACEQWRRDLDSCREWEERRTAEAQVPGSFCLAWNTERHVPGATCPALTCIQGAPCCHALEDSLAHCTASRKPRTIAGCCEKAGWAVSCSSLPPPRGTVAQQMVILRFRILR